MKRIVTREARSHDMVWRKSSYSGDQGDCVEVAWVKSSYSAQDGECVEFCQENLVTAVRDSKDLRRALLRFPDGAWGAFVARVKAGVPPQT